MRRLLFLKADKIDVIAFLTPFKEIIEDTRQVFRDLLSFYIPSVEEHPVDERS